MPGRSLRILVADDNTINQIVARGLLARLGHDVTIVSNGQEVIDRLGHQQFDLILMDIQMPIMDGYQSTAEIRRIESMGSVRTPIVALTAYAMNDERQNCLDADMDDYLSKPISTISLKALLSRFSNKKAGPAIPSEVASNKQSPGD